MQQQWVTGPESGMLVIAPREGARGMGRGQCSSIGSLGWRLTCW